MTAQQKVKDDEENIEEKEEEEDKKEEEVFKEILEKRLLPIQSWKMKSKSKNLKIEDNIRRKKF